MARRIVFTEKQRAELLANPYTAKISAAGSVSFTVEFKQFAYELYMKGVKPKKIYQMAGYDPALFAGDTRSRMISSIVAEAQSPEGFRDPLKTRSIQKQRLEEMKTQKAIQTLQNEIVYLEQQIEFLKKIMLLDKQEEQQP
ncbi:MAG: hypothetical protein IKZ78_03675 [Firmicutes bacterium]|nr:hypothetical protein [Bacillota bacterium]